MGRKICNRLIALCPGKHGAKGEGQQTANRIASAANGSWISDRIEVLKQRAKLWSFDRTSRMKAPLLSLPWSRKFRGT